MHLIRVFLSKFSKISFIFSLLLTLSIMFSLFPFNIFINFSNLFFISESLFNSSISLSFDLYWFFKFSNISNLSLLFNLDNSSINLFFSSFLNKLDISSNFLFFSSGVNNNFFSPSHKLIKFSNLFFARSS